MQNEDEFDLEVIKPATKKAQKNTTKPKRVQANKKMKLYDDDEDEEEDDDEEEEYNDDDYKNGDSSGDDDYNADSNHNGKQRVKKRTAKSN